MSSTPRLWFSENIDYLYSKLLYGYSKYDSIRMLGLQVEIFVGTFWP